MGPKMLADELTVTAHLSGGKTRVHKTSAREYLIKNYGKSEALDALTDALLSYGAAVQIYENYRTDCLACNIGTGTVPENSDTVTYIVMTASIPRRLNFSVHRSYWATS